MSEQINAGYRITESIKVGESEFVLGVQMERPGFFVTWQCKNGQDYFWGHYFDDEFAAKRDLCRRVTEQIDFLEELKGEKSKSPRTREQER